MNDVAEPVDEKTEARHAAIRYLSRREHSADEIRSKLRTKSYPERLINEVVDDLLRQDLVSDERFAEAYVRSRCNRGFGPVRIQQELRERGVAEELISEYVDKSHPHWLKDAEQVRIKRFGVAEPAEYADRAKQMRYLQYRGFTHDQINRSFQHFDQDI